MGKITLLIPRIDETINKKYTGNGTELSLGMVSLLSFLSEKSRAEFHDLDFEDFDPGMVSNSNIVGINSNVERRSNAVELARLIKKENPHQFIVFGGTYVSCTGTENVPSMAEICLNSYNSIDAVIVGPGEVSLSPLTEGIELEKIPNLVLRKNGTMIKNKLYFPDLDQLPIPNISLINPENYFDAFKKKSRAFYEKLSDDYFKFRMTSCGYEGIIPVLSSSGCLKAEKHGKCNFCSIPYVDNVRTISATKFWDTILYYTSLFGEGYLYSDKCDTFTADKNRVRELLRAKPNDISVPLRIYARLDNLADEEMLELLTNLGVKEMQIGLDSFDKTMVDKMNKRLKPDEVIKAFENLSKTKIYPVISVIYGFPGETYETANTTFEILKDINKILRGRFDIYASPCVTYPSTMPYIMAYKGLLGEKIAELVQNNFLYPIAVLTKEVINGTTSLGYGGAVDFVRKSFEFGLKKTDFLRSFGAEY